ncbi:MAG: cytochrome c [Vicinamibacterales bacterium]
MAAGLAAVLLATGAALAQPNPEAAKIRNPVPVTPESLAAGEAAYAKHCRGCHARDGAGSLGPSLIDDEWNHGSSDGEMFVVIRDGGGQFMDPWDDRLNEQQIWSVVNYIRSLKPAK